MARAAPVQSNFNGGEFSPLMYGRVDAERYKTGLTTALNYIPTIQGPLLRRPGTKYVAPTKGGGSSAPMLVRFEFSTTQAYILEFGNLYMRPYKNNAAILETAQNITAITNANPAVVTIAGHPFVNGDEVEIYSVGGMTQLNGRRFTVANAAANTFELSGINSTAYGVYTAGGTAARVYTVVTPYATADLFALRMAQSADVLYIAHPSYKPRKLERTGHTAWMLSTITFLDGPYLAENSTAITLQPTATTGAITITASSSLFVATDVGRLVRIKHAATWGYAEITSYTSGLQVGATVKSAFGATTASAIWRLGVWSDTTAYPAAVTFHQDRLVFGGPTSYPQRLDGSNTGDYENMAPSNTAGTISASNAISFTLNSSDVNAIRWLRSDENGLLVGTARGEWVVRPSSQSAALTPTDIDAKLVSRYGSANVDPVQAGKATMFLQSSQRKLREMSYLYEVNSFRSPDLTLISEHVTKGGLKQMAYHQEPQPVVWGVRNDGVLIGMTYEREPDALRVGWHRHILGGTSDAGGSAAVVESVAVIPSADGTRDEAWLVVKRHIGAQTVRYVEYIDRFFDEDTAQADAYFVDCGLTYSGGSTSTITGLWHLEGQSVAVLADGATHPNKTVSSGTITLDRAATKAHIGYSFNSDGQLLRSEAGAMNGTAQGKTKRTNRVAFMLHRTLGLKIGRDFSNLNDVQFRNASDPMGAAVPLFSGVKSETVDTDYDFDGRLAFRQDQPLPGIILAIMPQVVTQDRG